MLNDKKYSWTIYIILFISIFSELWAQTSQWRLIWDKNPENDVSYYLIFRGNNSLPDIQIGSINHPDTIYVDADIERGVIYYYRVKAIDFSGNQSDFSEEASAAIPKIEFPDTIKSLILPAENSYEIDLDDFVLDPDNTPDQLAWKITGNIKLFVEIDSVSHVAKITTPINWSNQENLIFTVTDLKDFFDLDTISVYSDTSLIPVSYSGINVYPIPYRPAQHTSIAGISFTNLPTNSILVIYNMLGEPVFKKHNISGTYIWNIKNNSDQLVNPGLYLYYIKNKNKEIASGKLIIIR